MNIEPVRGISSNCFQDLIITISTHWERAYELSFAEAMNVKYNSSGGLCIGPNIEAVKHTSFDLLREFAGIDIQEMGFGSSTEAYAKVVSELQNSRPVIIYISSFWNPWGNPHAYQQIDDRHFCLAIGVEDGSNDLICIDPTFSKQRERLPFDHFINGNNGLVYVVQIDEPSPFQVQSFLGRIADHYFEADNAKALHLLAQTVAGADSLKREFLQTHDFWASLFFQKVDTIFFARNYFYAAIKHVCSQNMDKTLDERLDRLRGISGKLSNNWEIIQKMLIRNYWVRETEEEGPVIQNLADRMKACAELEDELQNGLSSFRTIGNPI
ncbi:hypothetical protein ACFQZE_19460 [Paenibacillus sp. GCM10027627]|uniref:hypothetical protein n=1 Tax=unclassified Paenibacillus TaxID=185978 RepID=UPI00362F8DE2